MLEVPESHVRATVRVAALVSSVVGEAASFYVVDEICIRVVSVAIDGLIFSHDGVDEDASSGGPTESYAMPVVSLVDYAVKEDSVGVARVAGSVSRLAGKDQVFDSDCESVVYDKSYIPVGECAIPYPRILYGLEMDTTVGVVDFPIDVMFEFLRVVSPAAAESDIFEADLFDGIVRPDLGGSCSGWDVELDWVFKGDCVALDGGYCMLLIDAYASFSHVPERVEGQAVGYFFYGFDTLMVESDVLTGTKLASVFHRDGKSSVRNLRIGFGEDGLVLVFSVVVERAYGEAKSFLQVFAAVFVEVEFGAAFVVTRAFEDNVASVDFEDVILHFAGAEHESTSWEVENDRAFDEVSGIESGLQAGRVEQVVVWDRAEVGYVELCPGRSVGNWLLGKVVSGKGVVGEKRLSPFGATVHEIDP